MKKFLKCMPHAQAFVEDYVDGSIVLTSYKTEAAIIDRDGWLTVKCWCSPTTRRHISAFMDEYIFGAKSRAEQSRMDTGSYQTAKALFEAKMAMDIHTGEVKDL